MLLSPGGVILPVKAPARREVRGRGDDDMEQTKVKGTSKLRRLLPVKSLTR